MLTQLLVGLGFLLSANATTTIISLEPNSTSSVAAYIEYQAEKHGIDPWLAKAIAKCESGFNPEARGDSGSSRGVWQFHLPAWPEITEEQAHSVIWSTGKAMQLMKEGKYNLWTCYRIVTGRGSS